MNKINQFLIDYNEFNINELKENLKNIIPEYNYKS